jgi:hypothetical protein
VAKKFVCLCDACRGLTILNPPQLEAELDGLAGW